ncbi:MAG: hypothetical protein UW55_C0010G0012 [Candidatus Giovannonibacteria bacterium GW2011_GWA2_44_26]|uniref:Uncharacterized protein n=1 Tax=Candidatus Giovannonibacteria bacterium GW2011_GWA2_44_26 TaxID=1618648 RepID=A0A0G1IUM7_9BACT|nr:MAG: hypothetical protein UW55_C0010G0012 [Candidatus Giovannonibacteria bacterium GW2011_GWA2_44_26]
MNSPTSDNILDWLGIVTLAALALFLAHLHRKYFQASSGKTPSSLSEWVESRSKEICKPERESILELLRENIYLPSPLSLALISGIVMIGVLISRYFFEHLNFFAVEEQRNFVLTIHAGVGAIIFALVIFVAESLRDKDEKDTARVLLRESLLFPLTVAEIEVFIYFLLFKENTVIPVIGVSLLAIYSLYQLIAVLISRYRFGQKRIQLLKDRIKQNIQQALRERVGNNLLIKDWLEKERIPLQYSPWIFSDDKENYYAIETTKTGTVSDIRLDLVEEIADIVDEIALSNGQTFFESAVEKGAITEISDTTVALAGKATKNDKRFLLKKFYDEVSDDSKTLLSFHKPLFGDNTERTTKTLEKIKQLADRAFQITKTDNFSEEMKDEMGALKDQFIQSIRDGKVDDTGKHIKTYLSLVESFLEFLKQCGGGFTYDQAREERKNFFGEWNEPQWILDAMQDAIRASIKGGNIEIIRKVIFVPFAISLRSLKFKDQYIFQKFIGLAPFTAYLANKLEDEDLKKDVNERNLKYLQETVDFNIVSKFRHSNDESDISGAAEATRHIHLIYQDLLKTHFDGANPAAFTETISTMERIYRESRLEADPYSSTHYENLLNITKDTAARELLERKIRKTKLIEEINKDIQRKKKELYFGFSGWILQKLRNANPEGKLTLKHFFDPLTSHVGNDIVEITDIFVSLYDTGRSDFWGWDWWDLASDGEVHVINTHDWLSDFYSVKSLQILRNKTEAEISSIKLPPSRTLANLAEEQNGSIRKILEKIADGSNTFNGLISDEERGKVSALLKLLENARQEQEKNEEKQLQEMPLEQSKIEEFWKEFMSSYDESISLRKIIKAFGKYSDKSGEEKTRKEPSLIGYNQLDLKEPFVKQWHISYIGHAESYGRGFANSENVMIFEKIITALDHEKEVSEADILPTIKSLLEQKSLKNPILLGSLPYNFFRRGMNDASGEVLYIGRWDWDRKGEHHDFESLHSYQGYVQYKNYRVPVFDLMSERLPTDHLCLVSLPELGMLEQYPPRDEATQKVHQRGIFFFQIIDLAVDEKERQKLMIQNPEWLQKYEDKEGYLKQKVIIKMYEKFDFKIKNKSAGLKLKIIKPAE